MVSLEEIKSACDFAHNLRRRVYVTVNMVFHEDDSKGLVEYLKKIGFKHLGFNKNFENVFLCI